MIRSCMRSLLAILFIAAAPVQATAATPRRAVREIAITYAKSPFTDFLYYLLYRNVGGTRQFAQLKQVVPLDSIKPYDGDSFLPEDATDSNVTSYDQLYALAEKHDDSDLLKSMLRQAEPQFPAFMNYWKSHIAPAEDRTIAAMRKEQRRWPPVAHLEAMERLQFPFKTMRIDMFALQEQGGSKQVPPTIYSTTTIPGLAWAIGHEGTHMMLTKGADYTHRPGGAEAVRLMTAAGGSEYFVQEALCLLMQAKMSIAAGDTRPNFLTSKTLADGYPPKKLLMALERDWPAYLREKKVDAADWLIGETIKTYGGQPVADASHSR